MKSMAQDPRIVALDRARHELIVTRWLGAAFILICAAILIFG